MGWLDIHKTRMKASGSNIRGAYMENTANFINNSIKDSPTYTVAEIEGIEYDTRKVTHKKFSDASGYEVEKLLFKPNTKINNGKIAKIEGEKWLIIFVEDRPIAPKAHIRLCNNELVFDNGNTYPCVIDTSMRDTRRINEEHYIDLPADALSILVEYNSDTYKIKEEDRFVIDGMAWEVQSFDRLSRVYNGNGIIELVLKKVPLRKDEEVETPNMPDGNNGSVDNGIYSIKIIGDVEVEIGHTSSYEVEVYKDGTLLPNADVLWTVDKGSIGQSGDYLAPNTSTNAVITARHTYINELDETSFIEATKEIEVFDNDEWGW